MTLSTQTSKAAFAGNGASAEFPLPFPFQREADIKALLRQDGAETPLALGTHYSLSGAGSAEGGSLLMRTPPATGATLVVWRAPAIVQEVDYVENSAFPAETHEAALDLLTMICQSLQEQIGRAVLYPVSTPAADVLDSTDFLDATLANKAGAQAAQAAAEAARDLAREAAAGMPYPSPMLNVKSYGARGDGQADDAPALLAALEAAVAAGRGCVFIPAGEYRLDSCVALSYESAAVCLQGAGQGVSVLRVPEANTAGALRLAASARSSQVLLRDFSVTVAGANPCTVIAVTQPPGGNQAQRSAVLRNVRISVEDLAAHHWGTGIDLTGCWRPLLDNVYVAGPFDPSVITDYSDASIVYAADCCLNLDGCYGPLVRDSYLWCAKVGISTEGSTEEGFMLVNTVINHVKKGVRYRRDSPEPSFWATDFHINARDRGIEIDGAKLVYLTNGLFYNEDQANAAGAAPCDIHLSNWQFCQVNGGGFHFDGNPARVHISALDDGAVAEQMLRVTGVQFSATAAAGIQIDTDVTGIFLSSNMWGGAYASKVLDNSGRAVILGPSPYNANSICVENADSGSTGSPGLDLVRRSASPAANDIIGLKRFYGMNSAGGLFNYGSIRGVITDPAAGAEGASLDFWTCAAGAMAKRMDLRAGLIVGAATGADRGAGTINMYGDLYHNGVKVVGAQSTGWTAFGGTADKSASLATGTVTLPALAQRVKAIQDALAGHGLLNA